MVVGKRIVALVVMALMATASPAVYQKTIQPLEDGFNCDINIVGLQIDDATYNLQNTLVFDAYISITNLAGVPAILSQLNLDVYDFSATLNRYVQIGTFNTTTSYTIDAGTTLVGPTVKGLLTLFGNQDPSQSLSNNAIATLIEQGMVSLDFKGYAHAGPLTFPYERTIALKNSFFDTNLVLSDIWNYNSKSSQQLQPTGNDSNVLVARVLLHNNSTIPMTFETYSFNLVNMANGQTMASGVPTATLFSSYDPDLVDLSQPGVRRTLMAAYGTPETTGSNLLTTDVNLPGTGEWENMLLGFNFTDNYPRTSYSSNTLKNMNWFMTQLFTQPNIGGLQLSGSANVTIGRVDYVGGLPVVRGIRVELGGAGNTPLTINSVILHQQYYNATNENLPNAINKNAVSLMQLATVGQMNVTSMDVDGSNNMVNMMVNSTVNFTDPYRLQFDFQALNTSYYQVASNYNTYTNLAQAANAMPTFAINRAIVVNKTTADPTQVFNITSGLTQIPQNLTISYNSSNYNNTGISKMFTDLGIDTRTLNFTNPLWLLGPSGFNVDPTVLIQNLIQNNIDPLMMLNAVNTAFSYHYGQDAYFPLRASSFGENGVPANPSGEPAYPNSYSEDLPTSWAAPNSNNFYDPPLITSTYDDVESAIQDYSPNHPQYLILREEPANTAWQNAWSNDGNTAADFQGFMSNYFSEPVGGSMNYLPPSNLMAWRIYYSSSLAPIQDPKLNSWWGYKYDALDNANPYQTESQADLHNWFIVVNPSLGDNDQIMFRQNYTIDTSVIRSPSDIKYANLSITYRYPSIAAGASSSAGRVGIGYYNSGGSEYQYVGDQNYPVWYNDVAAFQGYVLPVPTTQGSQNDWAYRTIDVTPVVNYTFTNYVSNYTAYLINDTNWLLGDLVSLNSLIPSEVQDSNVFNNPALYQQQHTGWYNSLQTAYAAYQNASQYGGIPANWNSSMNLDTLQFYQNNYLAPLQYYISNLTQYLQPLPAFAYSPTQPTPGYLQNYLMMEVSFAEITTTQDSPMMFFDDVNLEIDYMSPSTQKFQLQDLFNYLNQNDPTNGNLFTLLDNIGFSSTNMMGFMDNDNGIASGTTGSNVLNYLAASNTNLNNIITLFQDNYSQIGSGQPLNFLQMLNTSEYTIATPAYGQAQVQTPYGPRVASNPTNYVVQDPYALSRALIQELEKYTFANPYKATSDPNMVGNELWMMFENLHVLLPWIIVYLYMHGWSKNDIFDALEAAGFSAEVKQNFYSNQISLGNVTENTYVSTHVAIGGGGWLYLDPLQNIGMQLVVPMANPINSSMLKLYNYLSAAGTRNVFTTGAPLNNPQLITLQGTGSGSITVLGFITIPVTCTETMTLTVQSYTASAQIVGLQGAPLYPKHKQNDPYVEIDANSGGLNDLGVQTLTNLMRQTVTFNGAPFMQETGDPLGLFSFLDNYFFNDPQTTYNGYPVPYSSYNLLNYFGVNAADFFDIISGYNPNSGQNVFDANGNGLADDWVAPCAQLTSVPSSYNWTSLSVKPTSTNPTSHLEDPLNGWGNNYLKNRIYWDSSPGTPYAYLDGHIMWTDSADLIENAPSGVITDPTGIQNFTYGAPPCVNLIDMLAWLSQTTGLINAQTIFNWLEGTLPTQDYLVQTATDSSYPGQCLNPTGYNHGIGLQKTWEALSNGTFNATGWFNYMVNIDKIDPYSLMNSLNNWPGITAGTGAPDPMALFYYMENPNSLQQGTGAIQWIYHTGVDGMNTAASQQSFWQFFNGSWWAAFANMPSYWDTANPWGTLAGRILLYINNTLSMNQLANGVQGSNRTFDYFQMLINLGILPEDWVNTLQNDNIKPFELLAVYDVMNFTKIFNDASSRNAYTTVMINGTFSLQISDISFNSTYNIPFGISPTSYTAQNDLSNFMNPNQFYTPAGTFSYHT